MRETSNVKTCNVRRRRLERVFFILGSLSGGLAVALGAFAVHGLRSRLTPDL